MKHTDEEKDNQSGNSRVQECGKEKDDCPDIHEKFPAFYIRKDTDKRSRQYRGDRKYAQREAYLSRRTAEMNHKQGNDREKKVKA
jgi:hypothetical protein